MFSREDKKEFAREAVERTHSRLKEFAKELVLLGQEIANDFDESIDDFEEEFMAGERLSAQDLRRFVLDYLRKGPWGEDEMGPMLADMIVYGKYAW